MHFSGKGHILDPFIERRLYRRSLEMMNDGFFLRLAEALLISNMQVDMFAGVCNYL
jgi:hypothetical protein